MYCPDNRFANSPKQIKFPALIGQILSPILDTDNSLCQQSFITLCLNEAMFYLLYLFRLLYAIKTWENIKKSTFFQEYGRLLPWTVDENQPYLISWLQNLVWRKEAVSSVSRNRCSAVLVTREKLSTSLMQQIQSMREDSLSLSRDRLMFISFLCFCLY